MFTKSKFGGKRKNKNLIMKIGKKNIDNSKKMFQMDQRLTTPTVGPTFWVNP